MKLNIHTLLHVPYEGLGCIEDWISEKGHKLSYTNFFENDFSIPAVSSFDWLIIMGGPMSVYEEDTYPWLKSEKELIRDAIQAGKKVLGICLGSQLIAEVLGAAVYPNYQKEIGWFDLKITPRGVQNHLFKGFEAQFPVFHWHGDTYDLPAHSDHLFYTDICSHQAFLYDNRVLGLQFHFEVTELTLQGMVTEGMAELVESETVQSAQAILSEKRFLKENNRKMTVLLDALCATSF